MARSTRIYMVIDQVGTPVAGFTVKHELRSWLTRQANGGRGRYRVWSTRDGLFQEGVAVDITEEVMTAAEALSLACQERYGNR